MVQVQGSRLFRVLGATSHICGTCRVRLRADLDLCEWRQIGGKPGADCAEMGHSELVLNTAGTKALYTVHSTLPGNNLHMFQNSPRLTYPLEWRPLCSRKSCSVNNGSKTNNNFSRFVMHQILFCPFPSSNSMSPSSQLSDTELSILQPFVALLKSLQCYIFCLLMLISACCDGHIFDGLKGSGFSLAHFELQHPTAQVSG